MTETPKRWCSEAPQIDAVWRGPNSSSAATTYFDDHACFSADGSFQLQPFWRFQIIALQCASGNDVKWRAITVMGHYGSLGTKYKRTKREGLMGSAHRPLCLLPILYVLCGRKPDKSSSRWPQVRHLLRHRSEGNELIESDRVDRQTVLQ